MERPPSDTCKGSVHLAVHFGATSSALTVVLITGRSTPSTGSTLDTPANQKFVKAWVVKYGTPPTNFEGETYLGMQVILPGGRRREERQAGRRRQGDVGPRV